MDVAATDLGSCLVASPGSAGTVSATSWRSSSSDGSVSVGRRSPQRAPSSTTSIASWRACKGPCAPDGCCPSPVADRKEVPRAHPELLRLRLRPDLLPLLLLDRGADRARPADPFGRPGNLARCGGGRARPTSSPTGTRRLGRWSRPVEPRGSACWPPRASAVEPTGRCWSESRRPAKSSSHGRISRGCSREPRCTSASSVTTTERRRFGRSTARRSRPSTPT